MSELITGTVRSIMAFTTFAILKAKFEIKLEPDPIIFIAGLAIDIAKALNTFLG